MITFKSLLLPFFTIALLTGCASSNNTLNINPQITLPQPDPTLMGITLTVNGSDQRQDSALAKVNRDGQLVTLTPSRDLRFLMQEVLEKQMASRGYMIGSGPELRIIINKLSADVQEGNLRHNIHTTAEISINTQTKNGATQVKNYRANYSVQGALMATNDKIAAAITTVLGDVINDMANDTSISEFIKQNSR